LVAGLQQSSAPRYQNILKKTSKLTGFQPIEKFVTGSDPNRACQNRWKLVEGWAVKKNKFKTYSSEFVSMIEDRQVELSD